MNPKADNCYFCDPKVIKKEKKLRNKNWIFLQGEGYNHPGVLVGAGVMITVTHKETPFDLTPEEASDMTKLLKEVKKYLDEKYHPDGYSIGWNVGKVSGQAVPHVHLHIMPRYNDEPLAGKGIRHFLKQETNKRKISNKTM